VTRALRVVLGAEHEVTRAGLRHALRGAAVEVCAEAATGSSAVEAVTRAEPDCCLLEASLPGNALAAVTEIKARRPATTVVILTETPSTADLLAALRAGASGYLPAGMDAGRLGAALEDATQGAAAIPRRMLGSVIEAVRNRADGAAIGLPADVQERLSPREAEVLALLGEELPTAAIAARLDLSPVTVRRHVSSLLEKLGVGDREAAVRLLRTAQSRQASDDWRPGYAPAP
jgi:DNA-binding NarL/FixJ family response regulator